jgi:hypothetical protein
VKLNGVPSGPVSYDPGAPPKERPETEEEKEARLKYQYPHVRYHEGDLHGMGSSRESQLENAEVWNRFGHNPDEATQTPPKATEDGRPPFKDLK